MGSAAMKLNCRALVIRNWYIQSSPLETASKFDLEHVLAWLFLNDMRCELTLLVYLTSTQLNREIIQDENFVITFMLFFHFKDHLIYEPNLVPTCNCESN